ncbi:thiopeptide-type bacteriocin biosynthesis protein [uncultured Abiotrophia sp.]|uniref:thiopeptide-type bacteriocin biosynthesis protein n=1 Tax=uncultured Abiotrophia sp. TaxID=316094 RepID=UPI002614EC33|nr:thiopeptide-type bacteriocin biosynthesis protein [uncultured Abiotrophia sp.]
MTKKNKLINQWHVRYNIHPYQQINEVTRISFDELLEYIKKELGEEFEFALKYSGHTLDEFTEMYEESNSDKKRKKIYQTLYGYVARYIARPTPFGAMSSIAVGCFSENTSCQYEQSCRVLVSSLWLKGLYEQLLSNAVALKKMRVKISPFILVSEEYLTILDTDSLPNEEKTITIGMTELLSTVIELVDNYTPVQMLIINLMNRFPNEDPADFGLYIQKLLELGVLVTDIFTRCQTTNEMLQNIYKASIGLGISGKLKEIINKIEEFNDSSSLIQIQMYDEVIEKMKVICISDQYLYLNKFSNSEFGLSKKYKAEIEYAGNVLNLFTNEICGEYLETYKQWILNRPDVYQPIPLLNLLVNTYNRDVELENREMYVNKGDVFQWLIDRIKVCSYLHEKEVVLTDLEIKKLESLKMESGYNKSSNDKYELALSIMQDKNSGQLKLIYNFESYKSGLNNYWARFNYGVSEKREASEILCSDENSKEIELLDAGFKQNVGDLLPSMLGYGEHLIIDSSRLMRGNIDLSKVFVHYENDKLLLSEGEDGAQIIPLQQNMVNWVSYYSRLYAFLLNIGSQYKINRVDFFRDLLKEFDYIPRIRHRNLTIFKQSWKIRFQVFQLYMLKNSCNTNMGSDQYEFFRKYVEMLGIPKQVGLVGLGTTLYYCLDNDVHIEYLLKLLLKQEEIVLTEEDVTNDEEYILGNRCSQFIFSFKGKDDSKADSRWNPSITNCGKGEVLNVEMFKNWFTFCIYLPLRFHDTFITDNLLEVYEIIEKFGFRPSFFIRYADPRPHLRVRLRDEGEGDLSGVLDALKFRIYNWGAEDYALTSFCPEIYRYNGLEQTMSIVNFFEWESRHIIERGIMDREELVSYIYAYLLLMNLTDSEIADILKVFKRKRERENYARINEKVVNQHKKMELDDSLMRFKLPSEKAVKYRNVVLSIIHMTVNRFVGMDRQFEDDLLITLYNLSVFRQHSIP